ncbi:hypothetical protein Tco_0366556 [Tanacetum coccineum]
MLGTTPNLFYDPNMKTGLGYQNPERLMKAIQAQPKLYNGKLLKCDKLNINLFDYEETLEEAEESRLKMKDKIIQILYAKLNALYDTFVPQKELSSERKYLSTPSTSNVVKEDNTKEVQEMLGVFESMESEVVENLKKHEIFQNEID